MKKKKSDKPKVHPELEGFNIEINEFGEIVHSHKIDKINQFLNKKVVDKKLKDRFGYKSSEDDDTVEFMYGDDKE
jgi:hypothetical protein